MTRIFRRISKCSYRFMVLQEFGFIKVLLIEAWDQFHVLTEPLYLLQCVWRTYGARLHVSSTRLTMIVPEFANKVRSTKKSRHYDIGTPIGCCCLYGAHCVEALWSFYEINTKSSPTKPMFKLCSIARQLRCILFQPDIKIFDMIGHCMQYRSTRCLSTLFLPDF